MKKSYRGLVVIAATVMSFISVQSVSAEDIEGTISNIATEKPYVVTVEGITGELTDVYGVKINYLANKYSIVLSEGLDVFITAELVECSTGEEVLRADSIQVGDVTVILR